MLPTNEENLLEEIQVLQDHIISLKNQIENINNAVDRVFSAQEQALDILQRLIANYEKENAMLKEDNTKITAERYLSLNIIEQNIQKN